jgi:hypothetical protein
MDEPKGLEMLECIEQAERERIEQAERRGRPRRERDPNERMPVSIRLQGVVFNQLSAAAKMNNRPLALECEYRLAASFDPKHPFPEEARDLALRLYAIYKHGGEAALISDVLRIGEPDNHEFRRRWRAIWHALQQEHPVFPRSGFAGDEAAFPPREPQPEEKP